MEHTNQYTGTNPVVSVITLTVSSLNALIKRQIVAEWIKKQDLTMPYLQETLCKNKTHVE